MTTRFKKCSVMLAVVLIATGTGGAQRPYFYPDDPIGVYPEPADASTIKPRGVSQGFDFVENSFLKTGAGGDQRARNVNTIDEVPDSSWFTNRIGARSMSLDELRRGNDRSGPASGKWKVVVGDASGTTPGFRMRDANGDLYFVKVDQPNNPEMVSGAEVISTKIFHALGYNVPENYVASFTPDMLDISEAQITAAEGRRRQMTVRDLDRLLARAARNPDGSYRVVASKAIEGSLLGPFRYYGTIPDDPNDIIPHEHRRELRGLRVFSAWVNHMDSRGINSLDTLVDVSGRKVVRHYLIDFGSTLGSASNAVKSRRSGYSYLWDFADSMRTLATFGLYVPSWAFVDYPMSDVPEVGRFEGDRFEPQAWVPHFPNPAFDHARPDDTFWAARRVMAFSDDAIRVIVERGQYTDPRATKYIADVLIKRRDKIGQAWLTNINPVVDARMDANGVMEFANAAVAAGVADAPREYRVQWGTFDNTAHVTKPHGPVVVVTSVRASAPADVLNRDVEFVQANIAAIHDKYPAWKQPVRVTFRRQANGWKTVGLERFDATVP